MVQLSIMHYRNIRIEKNPPIPEKFRQAKKRKGKHFLKAVMRESSDNGIVIKDYEVKS